jgi:uncharacterized protein YkwD
MKVRHAKALYVAAIVGVLLLGCGGGSSGACEIDRSAMVQRLTELRGSPIAWSDSLARAAQTHADDMARHGFAAHTGSDGSTAPDRAQAQGWSSRYVGENLSAGESISDQQAAQTSWERSAPHMKNTLHPGYTHAGLGCASSETGYRMYWVQVLGGE